MKKFFFAEIKKVELKKNTIHINITCNKIFVTFWKSERTGDIVFNYINGNDIIRDDN